MFLKKRQQVTHAVAAGAFVLLYPLILPYPPRVPSTPFSPYSLLCLHVVPPWMRALQSS